MAKKGYNKKELEHFKQLLLETRDRIVSEIQHNKGNGYQGEQEKPKDFADVADVATDSYDTEFALGLAASEEELLREIDLALKKIKDGGYGLCEKYETLIPKPRLEVMPYARYCVQAQEEEEQAKRMGGY